MKKSNGASNFKTKLKEMKVYCITVCIIVFLVCFAYALGYLNIINLHDMRFWLDSSSSASTSSSSSSSKPETDLADVTVEIYMQNAENGDYELRESKFFSVLPDEAFEYEPVERAYYFLDESLSSLIAINPDDDTLLKVFYTCETCTVTFSGGEGSELQGGYEEQVIRKGQTPIAPEYYNKGYKIIGYEPQLKKTYQDTDYTALWQEKEITITLNLTFGAFLEDEDFLKDDYNLNCYKATFLAVTDESLILPIPTYEGHEFKGWYLSVDGEGDPYEMVEQGTECDLILYSVFDAVTYEMSFVMDSNYSSYQFQSIIAPAGVAIQPPVIPPSMQIPGWGLNWYSDEEYKKLYTFTVMPNESITLYGTWEEDIGAGIFALDLSDKLIESEEEFILFLEASAFLYSTSWIDKVEVTFATKEEITQRLQEYLEAAKYSITAMNPLRFERDEEADKLFVTVNIPINWKNQEASLTTEGTEKTPYDYVINNYGEREDYTGFYIDGLPLITQGSHELTISTSNQLIYVVEHGYQPICKKSSNAERVYLEARRILNSIIGVNFTDYQKMVAIFDYLALNVQYDENALNLGDKWAEYDAFALEGVFDNKKAVCDGIAKAFSLMCNIEGIPCVRVRGNEHAWCKVKINNRWTVVDPTHANIQFESTPKSVIAHEYLSMTDAQKSAMGYSSNDYASIVADYVVNYYENSYFTLDDVAYDLVMENATNITALLDYCMLQGEIYGKVIDFNYAGDLLLLTDDLAVALNGFKEKYQLNDVAFSIQQVECEYGIVVRIIFNSVEDENADEIK